MLLCLQRIDDCIKLQRRVDDNSYRFPDPSILETNTSPIKPPSSKFHFKSNEFVGPKFSENEDDRKPIFSAMSFLLSESLDIAPRLRRSLELAVQSSGGSIATTLDDANTVITDHREGRIYIEACRRGLALGNLRWLYSMLAAREYTTSLRNLLHFPVDRYGIQGMRNMTITVSNYTGEARTYLQKLVEACGATFTKNMKPENTHLITAGDYGLKYQAAKDWNIHVVNHLWLEETYQDWQVKSVANPRYTQFPQNSALMDIIASTPVDVDAIRHTFDPQGNTELDFTSAGRYEGTEVPQMEVENKKVREFNDMKMVKGTVSSRSMRKSDDADTDLMRPRIEALASSVEPLRKNQVEPLRKNHSNFYSVQTPLKEVFSESNTPFSSARRRAKDAASMKLHDSVVPDMNLFEKEKRRKTFRSAPRHEGFMVDNEKKVKRQRIQSDQHDERIRLVMTGCKEALENNFESRLNDLGIYFTEEYEVCNYLAAPSIQRTEKFMCAIASAPVIIDISWIKECLRQNRLVDSADFHLRDEIGEQKYKCNLSETVIRARRNNGELFASNLIYLSPSIRGGVNTIRKIIEHNGGRCHLASSLKKSKEETIQEPGLIIVTTDEDRDLWPSFIKRAKKEGKPCFFFSTDWILNSVLRQKVDFSEEFALG